MLVLSTLNNKIYQAVNLFRAGDRNRTYNLLITNQLLCQLSYTSKNVIVFVKLNSLVHVSTRSYESCITLANK